MGNVAGNAVTGAAIGSAAGPVGTVVGGLGGAIYGMFSGDDSTPPPAPTPMVAPTLDQNAGIGQGYFGMTPEQAADQEHNGQRYKAQRDAIQSQINDIMQQKAANALLSPGDPNRQDPSAFDKTLASLQQQQASIGFVDTSDPAVFAHQAMIAHNRQAFQAPIVHENRSAADVNAKDVAAGGVAEGNQITLMQNDKSGADQQALIDRYKNDLTGAAPSLAQAQLAQTTDQNLQAQRSMVATAGPMDFGATSRAAVMAGANTQQQAIQQAAILRAQEYAEAEKGMGTATAAKRTEDVAMQKNILDGLVSKRAADLQAMGYNLQDAQAQAASEAQQGQFNSDLAQRMAALNDAKEKAYTDAYQHTQDVKQANAIETLHAGIATNGQNSGAGSANYATGSSNAITQQQIDDQRRRDLMNSISAGYAAYATSQAPPVPKAPPVPTTQQPTTGPAQPTTRADANGLETNNPY